MSTYYNLLGVDAEASTEAITAAYHTQRERYSPSRVADLDPAMRQIAEQRSADLAHAYQILTNPERRRQYDSSLRPVSAHGGSSRRGLSTRERAYVIGGALIALGLIVAIWLVTGRGPAPQGVEMGEVRRPAPAFQMQTLDGAAVSLADLQGKVVLLNFWATWCEPCQREMPALQAAHNQLGEQGLTVIGVDLTDDELAQGGSEEDIRRFVDQFNVSYPIALDRDGSVTNAYRVFPLPTSFFINPAGQIRYIHVGELTLEDVRARFAELRDETMAQPVAPAPES